MNIFVEKYKHERKRGYSEYEAFGIVANHIAVGGTFDDLQEVYDVHMDDFSHQMEKWMGEPSNLTSYERGMKLSGMKESDFE